ncbi:U4/U6 small nuclear ribonucleoprotein Prp31-like, partial [Trifolium medium]|nr:U4/U6 small nuclear ribonucleoprotein Prp31-like [Trifolium medium]
LHLLLQATLADILLADLDELSDNEAEIPAGNGGDAADMDEDVDDLDSVSK